MQVLTPFRKKGERFTRPNLNGLKRDLLKKPPIPFGKGCRIWWSEGPPSQRSPAGWRSYPEYAYMRSSLGTGWVPQGPSHDGL